MFKKFWQGVNVSLLTVFIFSKFFSILKKYLNTSNAAEKISSSEKYNFSSQTSPDSFFT
jgi:hypothetical protein